MIKNHNPLSEWADKILAFTLGIFFTFSSLVYIYRVGVFTNKSLLAKLFENEKKVENVWKPLARSTTTGYPVITTEAKKLNILDIKTRKLRETGITAECCGGAMYLGNIDPEPSQNLEYTAYIDASDKSLWVLSNATLEKIRIPGTENVTYISAWSPDNRAVAYYFSEDTVSSRKDGPGGDWNVTEKFEKNTQEGFYMTDITNGVTTKLSPLKSLVSFIKPTEILTTVNENNEKLVIFDLENYMADYSSIESTPNSWAGQYNFSSDGNKWSYIRSKNPYNDVTVYFADFPHLEDTEIASGDWAEYQWPKISPDSNLVAYQKTEGELTSGIPNPTVWVYNSQNKTNEKRGDGTPLAWADNETLVIKQTTLNDKDQPINNFAVLNIRTGEVTKVE